MNIQEELKILAEGEEECNEGVELGTKEIKKTIPKKVASKKTSPKPKAKSKKKK